MKDTQFAVWIDRGNGLEDDGCWLTSDEDRYFDTLGEAKLMAEHLKEIYPDAKWVVTDSAEHELYWTD